MHHGDVTSRSNSVEAVVRDTILVTWGRLCGTAELEGISFVDAGGDSLGLMELVFSLERALDARLPLDHFHVGLTAGAFIATVLTCVAASPEPGVPDPVFLCPASHGDSPYLAEFRRCCGELVGFVTLRYPDWRDCLSPEFGLRTMVDELCADIVRHRPAGAVRLAGFSMGGWLAYEAAVALEATGREVSFLGILDVAAPGAPGPDIDPKGPTAGRLRQWWWALGRLFAARQDQTLARRLGHLVSIFLARPTAVRLLHRLVRTRFARTRPGRTRPGRTQRPAEPSGTGPGRSGSGFAGFGDWTGYYLAERLRLAACRDAFAKGQTGRPRLRVPVDLFRCATARPEAEPDFGWSRVAHRVRIVPVPGDHFNVMRHPQVTTTSAAFVGALERSRRDGADWGGGIAIPSSAHDETRAPS